MFSGCFYINVDILFTKKRNKQTNKKHHLWYCITRERERVKNYDGNKKKCVRNYLSKYNCSNDKIVMVLVIGIQNV